MSKISFWRALSLENDMKMLAIVKNIKGV